jgi:hypothetical protein
VKAVSTRSAASWWFMGDMCAASQTAVTAAFATGARRSPPVPFELQGARRAAVPAKGIEPVTVILTGAKGPRTGLEPVLPTWQGARFTTRQNNCADRRVGTVDFQTWQL